MSDRRRTGAQQHRSTSAADGRPTTLRADLNRKTPRQGPRDARARARGACTIGARARGSGVAEARPTALRIHDLQDLLAPACANSQLTAPPPRPSAFPARCVLELPARTRLFGEQRLVGLDDRAAQRRGGAHSSVPARARRKSDDLWDNIPVIGNILAESESAERTREIPARGARLQKESGRARRAERACGAPGAFLLRARRLLRARASKELGCRTATARPCSPSWPCSPRLSSELGVAQLGDEEVLPATRATCSRRAEVLLLGHAVQLLRPGHRARPTLSLSASACDAISFVESLFAIALTISRVGCRFCVAPLAATAAPSSAAPARTAAARAEERRACRAAAPPAAGRRAAAGRCRRGGGRARPAGRRRCRRGRSGVQTARRRRLREIREAARPTLAGGAEGGHTCARESRATPRGTRTPWERRAASRAERDEVTEPRARTGRSAPDCAALRTQRVVDARRARAPFGARARARRRRARARAARSRATRARRPSRRRAAARCRTRRAGPRSGGLMARSGRGQKVGGERPGW